ncbi:hypothetical protein QBC39DRAFT_432446 [Podospora conica]|nr:hypothetical protein QBC39DRAFT_432446 [Schizothecium conicum]
MRLVILTATLGVLPTVLGAGSGAACSQNKALRYLARSCRSSLPDRCVADVARQASAFCSSLLSATTAEISTAASTVTVVETATTTVPSPTQITATTVIPFRMVKPRRVGCPSVVGHDLSKPAVAAKLTSACHCLGISAATTAAPTQTLATTTTTTTTTTATETPHICDARYAASTLNNGYGELNWADATPATDTGRECCMRCWTAENCVAAFHNADACRLLTKLHTLEGAPVTGQCPLGVEGYEFRSWTAGAGETFKGPCWVDFQYMG